MKTRWPNGAAVMLHDSATWRLYTRRNGAAAAVFEIEGSAGRLPRELIEAAVREGCKTARIAMPCGIVHIEGATPKSMPWREAEETMRRAAAESTGQSADALAAAGLACEWPSTVPFTLASAFSLEFIFDAKADLAAAGIAFAGAAPLELAIVSAWRASRDKALCVFFAKSALAIPPARRDTRPQTAPCGARQFAAGRDAWLARLMRAMPPSAREAKMAVAAPTPEIAAALSLAGFAAIEEADTSAILLEAAEAIAGAKPNRIRAAAPVADPFAKPGRAKAYLAAASAIAVLAAPAAFRAACENAAESEIAVLAAKAAHLAPLERDIETARAENAAAAAALASAKAAMESRIASRRALVAFVEAAYFFCKAPGPSVRLDSLKQSGDTITAEGVFSDPEDGAAMSSALVEYARSKALAISRNETAKDTSDPAGISSRFTIGLDCRNVGRTAK